MQDGSEVQAVESFMVAHNTGGNFEAKRITLEQLFQITDELDQELPIHSDSLLLVKDGQAYRNIVRKIQTIAADSHSVYARAWGVFEIGRASCRERVCQYV